MSGVARGAGGGRLARAWQRWRFHLSALLILAPILAFPVFLREQALFSGVAGLGEREVGAVEVGPWTLRLAEFNSVAPIEQGIAGPHKMFAIALCEGCEQEIRASYARIGKPRSLRAAGAIFSGSAYRQTADVAIPPRAAAEDGLWLTLEGWDGALHHAEVPLAEASPATLRWLQQQGGRR